MHGTERHVFADGVGEKLVVRVLEHQSDISPYPPHQVTVIFGEPAAHDLDAPFTVQQPGGVSFAIMGEMKPVPGVESADAFVVLLASVDSLASVCRALP